MKLKLWSFAQQLKLVSNTVNSARPGNITRNKLSGYHIIYGNSQIRGLYMYVALPLSRVSSMSSTNTGSYFTVPLALQIAYSGSITTQAVMLMTRHHRDRRIIAA